MDEKGTYMLRKKTINLQTFLHKSAKLEPSNMNVDCKISIQILRSSVVAAATIPHNRSHIFFKHLTVEQ